jgi:Zn-dependent protease
MNWEIQFKIFNIPVRIHLYFLIIVVFLSTTRIAQPALLVSWVAVVTVSVILHELGHALAARAFGREPSIELIGIGGVTYTPKAGSTLAESLITSLAGPLVGIIIGLSFLWLGNLLKPVSPVAAVIIGDIVWVNLYWSLANLLPVLPLDGGNIALALLARLFKKRGHLIAALVSFTVSAALAVYTVWNRYWFAALLLGFLALYNLRQLRYHKSRGRDAHKRREVDAGYALLEHKQYDEAEAAARAMLEQAENPRHRADALNLLGWALFLKRDYAQALKVCETFPQGTRPDDRLLAFLYFNTKDFKRACPHFKNVFYNADDARAAEYYVLCLLECGRPEEAYKVALFAHTGIESATLRSLAHDLFKQERFDQCFTICSLIYAHDRSATAAYDAACALARKGEQKRACAWLRKAVKSGFRDADRMRSDKDLGALRGTQDFKKILDNMRA